MTTPSTTTTTTPPFTLSVAGFSTCKFFQKATGLVAALKLLYPQKIIHEENSFPTKEEYKAWLETHRVLPQYAHGDPRVKEHGSSPFVTLNGTFLGGCDDTIAWARRTFGADAAPVAEEDEEDVEEEKWVDDGFTDIKHGPLSTYDLIVIGGEPCGIACAKEAASLGANVALVDSGPTLGGWGLGRTCLNVGSIPKFFFKAALVGEIGSKQEIYGWGEGSATKKQRTSTSSVSLSHSWQTLRENIQNHIRSVHFANRVSLRDSGVTYLNRYATFVDKHTLYLKNQSSEELTFTKIDAPRYCIAIGGCPSVLSCPGGEHAIRTDELFSLEEAPGKTCVIADGNGGEGDGYIALECAGFLKSLGNEVTIATSGSSSSSLLGPAFDRECAEKVVTHMTSHCGITILYGVAPVLIARELEAQKGKKKGGGKPQLRITFSNGQGDLFDTVLNAQGRSVDLDNLAVNDGVTQVTSRLAVDPTTKRLLCKDGQTSLPHIYAVGDVVHTRTHTQQPSLSTVATQAGERLARRLYGSAGGDKKKERKSVVPRVVLTPLEYASVGLTEEEVNKEEVQVLRSSFVPLEWSLLPPSVPAAGDGDGGGESESLISNNQKEGFVKALVNKSTDKVTGLHYLGPNAADVIQGFAVAMNGRGGLSLTQLTSTLGIVPSNAQALTKLSVAVPSPPGKKARK